MVKNFLSLSLSLNATLRAGCGYFRSHSQQGRSFRWGQGFGMERVCTSFSCASDRANGTFIGIYPPLLKPQKSAQPIDNNRQPERPGTPLREHQTKWPRPISTVRAAVGLLGRGQAPPPLHYGGGFPLSWASPVLSTHSMRCCAAFTLQGRPLSSCCCLWSFGLTPGLRTSACQAGAPLAGCDPTGKAESKDITMLNGP